LKGHKSPKAKENYTKIEKFLTKKFASGYDFPTPTSESSMSSLGAEEPQPATKNTQHGKIMKQMHIHTS